MLSATAVFISSAHFNTTEPLLGARDPTLRCIKFIIRMVCFLLSVLTFMKSVRYINHVNFLINVPLQTLRCPPEYVSTVLAKGCNFHTVGIRAFYFVCPLFMWLLSPIAMLCSCTFLVPLLYYLDVSGLDQQ
ncbi:uncharacterized protein [Physcomitrium patens]|uniref:uncharacterized protein isoform X2 n=1 Tax=Physcomitrium patens TaxID=3218 RepID=UPI003CCCAE4A